MKGVLHLLHNFRKILHDYTKIENYTKGDKNVETCFMPGDRNLL